MATFKRLPRCCTLYRPRLVTIGKSYSRTFTLKSQIHMTKNEQQQWRNIFEECTKKNNWTRLDWCQKPSHELLDEKSAQILKNEFNGSMYTALSAIFPEQEWHPWQFKNEPIKERFWPSPNNQKVFFDWLGRQVGVKELDDWYSVLNQKLLMDHGGISLLSVYNGSAIEALKSCYPNHNWIPWKFNTTPHGFWQSTKNQRAFFDWLGTELGIKELDDWYPLLSKNIIVQKGGSGLISHHKGSAVEALQAAYPEHNWLLWKFKNVPNGFWNSEENRKKFVEWLAKELNVKELDDWYPVLNAKAVINNGGASLLWEFNGSPIEILKAIYPEHNWIPWRFKCCSQGFWKSLENQKKYFDWLGKQLQVKELDDWYSIINRKVLMTNSGGGLLTIHNGSPADALKAAYPDHNWMPWKFNVANHGFWSSQENQRKYFDWLGNKLDVKKPEDWYSVLNHKVLTENGGVTLMSMHRGVINALRAAYPEHKWEDWKFQSTGQGYWGDKQNIQQFLVHLSETLSIQTLEDWYRVDLLQLKHFGAGGLLRRHKSLYHILKQQYPDYPWDIKRFFQKGRKGQRWLVVTLKKMFPNEEILEDYMHPKTFSPSTKRPMQLDVYIPSKSLAFEYQGIQHYQDVGMFGPSKQYQRRDDEKKVICASNNIKLIEVPYWWNRTQEDLLDIMTKAEK